MKDCDVIKTVRVMLSAYTLAHWPQRVLATGADGHIVTIWQWHRMMKKHIFGLMKCNWIISHSTADGLSWLDYPWMGITGLINICVDADKTAVTMTQYLAPNTLMH